MPGSFPCTVCCPLWLPGTQSRKVGSLALNAERLVTRHSTPKGWLPGTQRRWAGYLALKAKRLVTWYSTPMGWLPGTQRRKAGSLTPDAKDSRLGLVARLVNRPQPLRSCCSSSEQAVVGSLENMWCVYIYSAVFWLCHSLMNHNNNNNNN